MKQELKTTLKNTQFKETTTTECCANCKHLRSYEYPEHYGYCKLVPNVNIHFQDIGKLVCYSNYIFMLEEKEVEKEENANNENI